MDSNINWIPTSEGNYTLISKVETVDNVIQESINVVIQFNELPSEGCSGIEGWQAKVYSISNSRVVLDGRIYENKWYAESTAVPGKSDVWRFINYCEGNAPDLSETCGFEEWDSRFAYSTAGTKIYYAGDVYENKWWTKGTEPFLSNDWSLVSSCKKQVSSRKKSNEIFSIIESHTIYPNPTSNVLYINSDKHIVEGSIYSLEGKIVKVFNSEEIDVSDLKSGTYIIRVIYSDKSVLNDKFRKE